jgi:hypothetical protein
VYTYGRYIGATIRSSDTYLAHSAYHMQYEMRAQWPQSGAQ